MSNSLANIVSKQGGGRISDALDVAVSATPAKQPAKARTGTVKAKPTTSAKAKPAKGKAVTPPKGKAKPAPAPTIEQEEQAMRQRLAIIRANKLTKATHYAPEAKITVLNKKHPHHEGSGRANAFAYMVKCKTVADYLKQYKRKEVYLQRWVDMGLISIK